MLNPMAIDLSDDLDEDGDDVGTRCVGTSFHAQEVSNGI
jgi:hypothetical protein